MLILTVDILKKRISKIETLRLALSYIELLMDTLNQSELPTDYLRRCANGEIKESKRWKTTGQSTFGRGFWNFDKSYHRVQKFRLDNATAVDKMGLMWTVAVEMVL